MLYIYVLLTDIVIYKNINMLNKFNKIAVLVLIGVGASGCMSTYEPSPYVNQINKSTILSSTAALTHTIIQPKDSNSFTCFMPQPDADFSQSDSGGVSFLNSGVSEGISDSESSGGDEMNGRTPGVLFSRDMMYRLCEFTSNYNLSKQEAIALYKQNISALNGLMLEESKNTTVTVSESLKNTYTSEDTNKNTSTSTESPLNSKKSQSSGNASTDQNVTDPTDTTNSTPDSNYDQSGSSASGY